MLWADEQTPLEINDTVLDAATKLRMERLASSGDMPSLALYGPEGTGRHTLARILIRRRIGADVFDRSRSYEREFVVETKPGFESLSGVWVPPERKSITLSLIQSGGHLEVRPSNAGYYDHLLIKGIIELVQTYRVQPVYLLISAADELSQRARESLKVQMEKAVASLRFIFVMSNLTRLGEALLSRCTQIRVPAKTQVQVRQVLAQDLRDRKLPALNAVLSRDMSKMSMRRALLCLQALYKTKKGPKPGESIPSTTLDTAITKRYQELKACLYADDDEVVEKLDGTIQRYIAMLRPTCPGSYLIKQLLNRVLEDHVGQDELCVAVVARAAHYESRLGIRSGGYHAPVHLGGFMASLYALLSGRSSEPGPTPAPRRRSVLPSCAGDVTVASAIRRRTVSRTAPPLVLALPSIYDSE